MADQTKLPKETIMKYIDQKRKNKIEIKKDGKCDIEFDTFLELLEHQSKKHGDDIPNLGQYMKESDLKDAKIPKTSRSNSPAP